RFRQFYVNSPICSPSRCAIVTGQYPQRWKITSFLENRASNQRRGMAQWLDPQAPALAKLMKENGYATGHFGKWHLGGQRDVAEAPPITAYGYDESLTNFEGMGPKLLPLTLKPGQQTPGRIWEDAVKLGGPATWMLRSKITTGYIDAALPFMDRAARDGKSFYVDIWPDDVHSPFWPPPEQWQEKKHERYLAVLTEMDRQLGKLFDHIRDTPALRDNTVVVIFSDNGPEPGAGSAGPFQGGKGTLHEGGIRSPLIVWAPGMIAAAKAGTVNDRSVMAAFDLAPSLAKLAKAPVPDSVAFDGRDFLPTLLGREEASRESPIFWRRPPDRKMAGDPAQLQPDLAVREGKWKLVCDYDGSSARLFDLEADRGEVKDLATSQPDIVQKLVKEALAWNAAMPADRGPQLGAKAEKREGGADE
ncbi:MAG: sulfatase, partial [Akkermansiaceae bacterium]|nr:sulfatase [Akkermansiaceae bacterium]